MLWCCTAEDEGALPVVPQENFVDMFPVLTIHKEFKTMQIKKPDSSQYEQDLMQTLEQLDGISFHPGSIELTFPGTAEAHNYVKLLKAFPGKPIKIVGFSSESASTLASDRCRAIRSFFEAQMCANGMEIESREEVDGQANKVTVEPCDPKIEQAVREQLPPEPTPCVKQALKEPPKTKVQVTLEFSGADGSSATLQLVRRPIGLTLDLLANQLMVKSVEPLSPGEDAGVKAKMVLTSVDGEPVADKSTDQAWKIVKAAVGNLPDRRS